MNKAALLLPVFACLSFAACKGSDDPSPKPDLLECPSDPAPVRGFGGKGNIVIPTAFSPNGDGRNDMLRIAASDTAAARSVTMRIVDADGNILHTFSRLSDAWDGYNANAGKHYPPGRYRLDYGITLHGGSGTDVALSGHTCIRLYATDSSGCLISQGSAQDVFEDQIDPLLGTAPYATAERFCH